MITVIRMSLKKTEAAKEVGLLLSVSDKTGCGEKNLCAMMVSLVRTVCEIPGNIQ